MSFDELDAVGQADLVRRGEATPSELVNEASRRMDEVNPIVNAVIHDRRDQALAEAASDALGHGPFQGVPFLVKDALCAVRGEPYHHGLRALRDAGWRAQSTSYLAKSLAQAGLLTIGRTNVPELTTSITTEPLAYGPTRNPWDTAHSAGGSSGGSAAAVAAGIVAAAHGNDMGGSIRIPASACGLVGLKPSRGRTSLGPDHGEYWGPSTHEGFLTRSVRDTAALLDAVGLPSVDDPWPRAPGPRSLTSVLDETDTKYSVGFRTHLPLGGTPAHPACTEAVNATVAVLAALGHEVTEAWPSALDSDDGLLLGTVVSAGVAREIERYSSFLGRPISLEELEPMNRLVVEAGRGMSATAYLTALDGMFAHARRLIAWWRDYDVFVTPTLSEPPSLIGDLGPAQEDGAAVFERIVAIAGFLTPWNITGQPAISLPVHETTSGLPVGVQLVAAPGREDVLIELAARLETALPWRGRRPAMRRPAEEPMRAREIST